MKQLVTLNTRPSSDGKRFQYVIRYMDENGKRRWKSLGHANKRKAERQCAQLAHELRIGYVRPESMTLRRFMNDSLERTGKQIRESTKDECRSAMEDFIKKTGNMDFLKIRHKHGEMFIRSCLDSGNRPATVAKKMRHLKRMFQLAVDRGQLEENPLGRVKPPKSMKKKVRIFSPDECRRILQASKVYQDGRWVRWDILVVMALLTGMRRGELLNCIWSDIDFDTQTVSVTPKEHTALTWEWYIKDSDRRVLPLTDEVINILTEYQSQLPEGNPYVFVPYKRYRHIQKLRKRGEWKFSDSRIKVVNNMGRDFNVILKRAGIKPAQFHDLRRTALSNWLANGMSEHDVMILAGHASFSTTHAFYLAVADDLVDRAREAAAQSLCPELVQNWCSGVPEKKTKKADNCNSLPAKHLPNGQGRI